MLKSRKNILILVTIAIIIIGIPLLYFLVLRTPNTDYETASDQLAAMQNSSAAIDKTLAAVHTPSDIDTFVLDDFQKSAYTFKTNFDSFTNGQVISKDQSVKIAYSQSKDSLVSYNQKVNDLELSMVQYGTLIYTCSSLVLSQLPSVKTVGDFDTQKVDCIARLGKISSLPSTTFKDTYLTKYSAAGIALIDAYRQQVAAGTNTATLSAARTALASAQQKVTELAGTSITLAPSSPASTIQKVQDVITSQSKALLR